MLMSDAYKILCDLGATQDSVLWGAQSTNIDDLAYVLGDEGPRAEDVRICYYSEVRGRHIWGTVTGMVKDRRRQHDVS